MGKSIRECLYPADDPRAERTRKHELHDVLLVAICSVICDAQGWCAMEEFGLSNEDCSASSAISPRTTRRGLERTGPAISYSCTFHHTRSAPSDARVFGDCLTAAVARSKKP